MAPDLVPTVSGTPPADTPPTSSRSSVDGRFPVGTVLDGRYRILRRLGRGGMGEVYQAYDSELDQEVALKFLPDSARDPSQLQRFRAEVRIARKVAHPNVCRVYDIGQADGAPFISMEYVDGEDLRSLLRRIGRLPSDKAIEIARRLSAGLGAAHAVGVLHRDLKPANIMLDGQGQVHIMDFGLADLAGGIEDVTSGTPAYMAPEQAEGREVTVRSDIYALGLVLSEMFTGRRAFDESSERSAPPSATETTPDVDPAVAKVIRKCLDPNPARRPGSALDVARALPGGDPLAEALAAGETPSPEAVAASEETGALSIRMAVVCLVFLAACLGGVLLLSPKTEVLAMIPAPVSGPALEQRSRAMITNLGYADAPVDSSWFFRNEQGLQSWAERNLGPDGYREMMARGTPSLYRFSYRQSPGPMIPANMTAQIDPQDPPLTVPGMVWLETDLAGRLLLFRVVPPEEYDDPSPPEPARWEALFELAGLDMDGCVATERRRLQVPSDTHAAWTCVDPELGGTNIQVYGESLNGRPVYFSVRGPWLPETGGNETADDDAPDLPAQTWLDFLPLLVRPVLNVLQPVLGGLLLVIAVLLARRHYRRGRGDLPGAKRLAVFAFLSIFTIWILTAHHASYLPNGTKLYQAGSVALGVAAVFWVLYMALEPYVRRRWPQSLISWTRILAGNWKDPVVAGHALAGAAAGMVLTLAAQTREAMLGGLTGTNPAALNGLGNLVALFIRTLGSDAMLALAYFFMYFLLRAILRRHWRASVVVGVLALLPVLRNASAWDAALALRATWVLLAVAISIWLVARFGVLSFAVAFFVGDIIFGTPMTTDLSASYSYATILALVIVLGLAAGSFYLALGGRPLLREDFLES